MNKTSSRSYKALEYALMLGNKSPFQVPCRTCTQWCHSSSLVFLLILSRISAYFYCTFTVFPHNEFCFSSQISLLPASKEKKKKKNKTIPGKPFWCSTHFWFHMERRNLFFYFFFFTYTPLMMIFQVELPVLLMKMHY